MFTDIKQYCLKPIISFLTDESGLYWKGGGGGAFEDIKNNCLKVEILYRQLLGFYQAGKIS